MHHLETLLVFSVEDFLSRSEAGQLCNAMDVFLAAPAQAGPRSGSVHSAAGYSPEEIAAAYEPRGRVEIEDPPAVCTDLLDAAFERNRARIGRFFPSAKRTDCWIYLEYGAGQLIASHVDFPHNDDRPEQPKVTGVSVLISEDFEGGAFYVETCASDALWERSAQGLERVRPELGPHVREFRELPRTRWVARQALGTALFFGTQVIHGTEPVLRGRVRKFVGFLAE